MKTRYIDQTGREIQINKPVKRIVSLVPSQTELLADLGLDDRVAGITKFCIHPDHWFSSKQRVGGTKTLHFDRIKAIEPDLIIANKEENEKEQILELMDHFPVWISDIKTLPEACEMILSVGELTGMQPETEKIVFEINHRFESLMPLKKPRRTAYLIWNNPMMCAGTGTFIDEMLRRCGFINAFGAEDRYPEITAERLKEKDPELILLSSEPFPFGEKHIAEFRNLLPGTEVVLVDGEIFSWYGTRLLKAPSYLKGLINLVEQRIK